jgi:putative ABC transport system permease protein
MLHIVRSAIARVRQLFGASRLEREQDEEFAFHLEMEIAHNKRLGMSEADARRAALLAFGGRERFREETRDARGVVLFDNLARDLRFALRRIRRAPGFAVGAIATLGIGIGAAAGIGTIVYGVLLRDLPYHDSETLVRVGLLTPGLAGNRDLHSEATYSHLASSARSLSAMAAYYTNDAVNITDGDEPERITVAMVTPNGFPMLGVTPIAGKLFATMDTAARGEAIPVLISERIWRRRYGGDTAIIGKRIEVNRGGRIVIGVLPHSFDFPHPDVDVWYPASVPVDGPSIGGGYLTVVGRLAQGASAERAEAELNALIPSISTRFPRITPDEIERSQVRVTVQSLKSAIVAPVRGHLVLLGIMVGVVLLIACTNVANLFLLRAEQARQETAIAISLGASRVALAQRFVTEGLLLGAASIGVAIPAAGVALTTKFGFDARDIPRLHEIGVGADTVALIVLAALVLGAIVGATALLRAASRAGEIGDALRGVGRVTGSAPWRRVQRALVAAQVAMACALLVSAGLLGRSFMNLGRAPLGFEPAGTMTFGVSLPFNPYGPYAVAAAFHARMTDRLSELPGVTGVASAMNFPLTSSSTPSQELRIAPVGAEDLAVASAGNLVAPRFFEVMGIPLLNGRTFAPGDLRATPPNVIISQELATQLFGTADPIGRQVVRSSNLRANRPYTFQVIGVAGDVPAARIEDGPSPVIYMPLLRDGDGLPAEVNVLPYVPRWVSYVMRGAPPTPATIRRVVREMDPRIPPVNIKSLEANVAEATARVRLTMLLLGVAAAAALMLGVVGVYSVVSYAAAGRLREFGVRLALGDTAAGVRRLVLRDGLALASAGIVAGVVLALVGGRFLRSLLYEVSPTSPRELTAAVLLLVAVTLLAALAPALRAARTDPAVVLRGE